MVIPAVARKTATPTSALRHVQTRSAFGSRGAECLPLGSRGAECLPLGWRLTGSPPSSPSACRRAIHGGGEVAVAGVGGGDCVGRAGGDEG